MKEYKFYELTTIKLSFLNFLAEHKEDDYEELAGKTKHIIEFIEYVENNVKEETT